MIDDAHRTTTPLLLPSLEVPVDMAVDHIRQCFPLYEYVFTACHLDVDGITWGNGYLNDESAKRRTASADITQRRRNHPLAFPISQEARHHDATAAAAVHPPCSWMIFPVTISSSVANGYGTLHGGMTAWLIDSLTSIHLTCIAAVNSVSVALNMTYLDSILVDQRVLVRSFVKRIGRQMAFLDADVVDARTGKVLVMATHPKAVVGAKLDMSKL